MPESSAGSPTVPIPADLVAACRAAPLPRLVEALREDQAQRWRSGDGLPAETYLSAFPGLADSADDGAGPRLGEALLRLEAGEAPSLEEFRSRSLEYADALALQFDLQRHLAASPDARPWPTVSRELQPARGCRRCLATSCWARSRSGGMGVVFRPGRSISTALWPSRCSWPGRWPRPRSAALPHRGRGGGPPRSSRNRAYLRGWRVRGAPVLLHEADRGRHVGRLPGLLPGGGTAARRSGPGGSLRPPARNHPSRPEAREHPAGPRGTAPCRRLRPGQAA